MGQLVLVCGSRTWSERDLIYLRLRKLPKESCILEGGAQGADLMARQAALDLGLDVIEVPANWKGRGKAAGPWRNRMMLDFKPALAIAFHGDVNLGTGTRDTVDEARRRGIPTEVILGIDACTCAGVGDCGAKCPVHP